MGWMLSHSGELWAIFSSVVTIASIVARLTKFTWDDSLVGFLLRLVSIAPKKPQ